jgi:hypothetical protein
VERRAQRRHMENHLYECLYDILRSTILNTDNRPALQRYKAKLVRLHAARRNKTLLDTQEHDRLDGEEPSLFHVMKMHKSRVAREIRKFTDTQGNTHISFVTLPPHSWTIRTTNTNPLKWTGSPQQHYRASFPL